jgi:hypothetical protein
MRTLPAALAATLLFAADATRTEAAPMMGHVTGVHSSYAVDPSRFPVRFAGLGESGPSTFDAHGAAGLLLKVGELAAVDSEGSSANGKIREPILLLLLGAGLFGLGGIVRRRLIKSRSLKRPSNSPSATVLTDAP